ncbi:adenylate/guanylate cyclase domain-containing protein [Nocardioides sp. AX2bis]|uniref:adenylate/guanylate cyclase domain-containing protein n=1 Tax=Nocardioides sp. AX2bis TaxID=2653157 RepID=UPI0012F38543|nr:adenylate/guanylate cyclase domain-containing protein [Nocardioides sp. AX2bis]VXC38546.1 Adenylate cyclase [Nocardioides sp. AX2bis]
MNEDQDQGGDEALPTGASLQDAVQRLEARLLDGLPRLTRQEVADAAGVPLVVAEEMWRLLGFARVGDDDVAFTDADVEALRLTHDLMRLGVLDDDSQSALVRTWGRSFARLAEWQTSLMARVALEDARDPAEQLARFAEDVLPRIDQLQSYVWRRHLTSAAGRLLTSSGGARDAADAVQTQTVCFVDIVGYTARSRSLDESELVAWLEYFEDQCAGMSLDVGARIIKNIGDEVLLVADAPGPMVALALAMTARGEDEDDRFPRVRAGVATGEVVSRLGDVFGSTVNVAARLTSVSRPGRVLVDAGTHDALAPAEQPAGADDAPPYRFKRVRRISVKGFTRLAAWTVRPRSGG